MEISESTSVFEEHVLDVLGGLTAAASSATELGGNLLCIACGAVDVDNVGRRTVGAEGSTVGV